MSEPDGRVAIGNRLIDSLRPADRLPLIARLDRWRGAADQPIYNVGDNVEYAYFPLGPALAAFRIAMADGDDVEAALVGREGALGGVVSKGRLPAFARSIVQFPGEFARIALRELDALKEDNPRIRALFDRYADCFLAQIFQGAACNACHTLDLRAARWLLAAADRTQSAELSLTQEQLACMLGVGRAYASRTLGLLRAKGLIDQGRGRIVLRDLAGLRALSCDCDSVVRRHFDEVLRGVYPPELIDAE